MLKRIILTFSVSCFFFSASILAKSLDAAQFQDHVLQFLQTNYKQYSSGKTGTSGTIQFGGMSIALDKLYQPYSAGQISDAQLDEVLKQYFTSVTAELAKLADSKTWDKIKDFVRPQMAPAAYLERANLVYHELDEHAIATYVVDDEKAYKYVTYEHLAQWKVSPEQLSAAAMSNLTQASANTSMNIANKGNKFIIIQTKDGYDAARIMVPEIQKFVMQNLGEPFYAAFPYRDFLIVWSPENGEEFESKVMGNIRQDHARQQYALSPNVFEISRHGIKRVNNDKKDTKEEKKKSAK